MKLLIKETFISIWVSYKRFLSILLIVLLGVGFFAGIKATSPDMKKTINKYYRDTKFQDIELLSTWGIKGEEIENLKNRNYLVEGAYSFESIVEAESEEVVKILSYNSDKTLNKIILLEGKFPSNKTECVIESNQYTKLHEIGDKIVVDSDNLHEKELTIVGIVKSPIYISLERGYTSLLSGKINYFIYCVEENFNMEYYTSAAIHLNKDMFTKSYDDLLKDKKDELKTITKSFATDRYDEEKDKALNEYNKSLKQFNKKKNSAKQEIKKAKEAIFNGKKEYQNGVQFLKINKKKYLEEYLAKKTSLENSQNELNFNLNTLMETLQFLENDLSNKNDEINEINNSISLGLLNSEDVSGLQTNLLTLQNEYDMNYSNYDNVLMQKFQLENNLAKVKEGLKLLESTNEQCQKEFIANETKLNDNKNKLNMSETEIVKKEKLANEEFEKIEAQLKESLEKINKIQKPEWYILDRTSNVGFYQFNQDIERIANLGQLFPLVFFIVAILICLTSMTRMVEEERSQLGTLKSLGFTNFQILFKYVLYALIATLVGSIIGLFIGFKILPDVIFNMYNMMYNLGNIILEYNIFYAILGTGVATFCTLTATIMVCIKSLKEQPSELMRPKSIKSGKRILLEKIPFIWKKLNFDRKVTMRNVFRYKKRMIMTIVGIAGCTGLIIAGFGLKDCITGMVSNQYEDLYKYQLEITLKDNKNNDDIYDKLAKLPEIKDMIKIHKEAIKLDNYETNQAINLIVYNGNINSFIQLRDRKTQELFELPKDKVIISEKISNLLKIKKNDVLKINGEKDIESRISNITENYMYHFIYMDHKLYKDDNYNTILVNTSRMNELEEKEFASKVQEIEGISKLSFTSAMSNVFDSTMKNFEYVVVVLIVSANLLAFVVLYNLASVNISERLRELATIKVLGFYDMEVYSYIGRETTILTALSMIFGVGTGKLLTMFIIKTCELDMIMFNPKISIMSYVYGILITIGFTIIVNVTTYFSLKKIEMVESLKSIE